MANTTSIAVSLSAVPKRSPVQAAGTLGGYPLQAGEAHAEQPPPYPIHARHPQTGQPICGARTRKPNRLGIHCCLNALMRNSSGRCRMRGGVSLRGHHHPNFKHGRYIPRDRSLPTLGQQLTDPDFRNLCEEIALIRVLIEERLEFSGNTPAYLLDQPVDVCRGIIGGSPTVGTTCWDEIRASCHVLNQLLQHEVKLEATCGQVLYLTDVVMLLRQLQALILDLGLSALQRTQLQQAFNALLQEQLTK